ncbi:nuclear transport factor 2 family protein [Kitasatospora sp. NBC_01287]|uniref:nuclear transport factor 2 family protein n=1 Tax=Kitasatospora sp. NBC_01287 TaxID=2903573 RepID=UPI00224D8AA6|nr:nuclear transport factor 2 family protein [Kitasatospora sp. NBC_01287]MCX4750416.1 nuclear transport factor 2 family protein [Kitasatospora sp. NBC_01287]
MSDPNVTSDPSDPNAFVERYIALWNEPDAELRRKRIADLFAPDAAHFTPSQEVRGHAELEVRVTKAFDSWVRPGEHAFRAVRNANGHHGAVRFNWEMAHLASGEAVSVGFDLVLLDQDGLITSDHQFIDR